MPSKKDSEKGKNKRTIITIAMKHKIIEKHKQGVGVTDLGRAFHLSKSTVSTILKNKERLEVVNPSKGVTRLSSQRSGILDDVERLLLVWITEKQKKGESVSRNIICQRAKTIFDILTEKSLLKGASTGRGEDFKASKGWFEKFKKRTGIQSGTKHGEGKDGEEGAENFVSDSKEDYLPHQIFNCEEIPKEQTNPGHKPKKDRLTLVLCANASGDLKLKHLPVYHHQRHNISKSKLKSNSKELHMDSNDSAAYSEDLVSEELVEYALEEEAEKQTLSDEETDEQPPSSGIIEMLKSWESVASYVKKHHPNRTEAVRATELFNDKVVSHFQQILKRRQKKTNLDKFLLKNS